MNKIFYFDGKFLKIVSIFFLFLLHVWISIVYKRIFTRLLLSLIEHIHRIKFA